MRIGVRPPCCAAIALAVTLALPALTAARTQSCQTASCTARITVGPEPVVFTSAERFDTAEQQVVVHVLVNEVEMQAVRRDGRQGCRRHLRGAGTYATVSVCGSLARVVVRASRAWGGSVRMEIRYRARRVPQGVKGVSTSSADSSGGVGPSGTGGVGAP